MTSAISYESVIAEHLTDLARAKSIEATSRCLIFGGFPVGVVQNTVERLRCEEPEATVKVDKSYEQSATTAAFGRGVILDRASESFTMYRNKRDGLTCLFVETLMGEERESTASVATIEPDDIRASVGIIVDRIPGAAVRFGPDYDQLKRFFQLVVDMAQPSLGEIVSYVLAVHDMRADGEPTKQALGLMLPCLGAFRWAQAFRTCDFQRPKLPAWRKAVRDAVVRSRDYSMKQAPNGSILGSDDLRENLTGAEDYIEPQTFRLLEAFVDAPITNGDIRKMVLNLDWKEDRVELLFKRASRRKLKLGEATIRHLEARLPGSGLSDAEMELLGVIDSQSDAFDEERERLLGFYSKYRAEILKDKRLANRWERELYPKDIEDVDFLLALAKTASSLVEEAAQSSHLPLVLVVSADASPQEILESINRDAFWYFMTRYRGIESLLRSSVVFKTDSFSRVAEYDTEKRLVPDSLEGRLNDFREEHRKSKGANRLTFKAQLAQIEGAMQPQEIAGAVRAFTWVFPPDSFLCGFRDDLKAHLRTPLASYRLPRSLVSSKGTAFPISLHEPRCVEASSGRGYGRLVPVSGNSEVVDLEAEVKQALKRLVDRGHIEDSLYQEMSSLLSKLGSLVESSLHSFLEEGLAWNGWLGLAGQYADILEVIHSKSPGSGFRQEVMAPLTRIGIVEVGDERESAAVCSPLHPLRLVSVFVKSQQLAHEVNRCLEQGSEFSATDLHDSVLDRDSAHPYYPQILVTRDKAVLAEVASVGEYSLMKNATGRNGIVAADDSAGAARVLEGVVAEYLALHPHEKANLSVLVHSVGSGGFAEEVVDRFSRSYSPSLSGAKCRLILQDADRGRLREQYRSLISSMDNSAEGHPLLLSRFRVATTGSLEEVGGFEAGDIDLAFLLDQVSRLAEVRWRSGMAVPHPDFVDHYPARWTRREPSDPYATHSGTYLCCPVNPRPVSVYYGILGSLFRDDAGLNLAPIRAVEYSSGELKEMLGRVHECAKWVVNYDALLDRHQLREHLDVDVVRYRPSREQGRNLIVSSDKPPHLLNAHLETRFREFGLYEPAEWDATLRAVVRKANDLSGNLVLKAAGRGKFTNELLGAILSAQVMRLRLPQPCRKHAVFVYLGDFGNLFSNRVKLAGDMSADNSALADLLCIAPLDPEAKRILLLVSEAKFLASEANLGVDAELSRRQLLATVRKLAPLGEVEAVDRSMWLSVVANVVLDSGQHGPSATCNPEAMAWAIRTGQTQLLVEGQSHVFVADREGPPQWTHLGEHESTWQGLIGRSEIRNLLAQIVEEASEAEASDIVGALPPLQTFAEGPHGRSPASSGDQSERQDGQTPKRDSTESGVHPDEAGKSVRVGQSLRKVRVCTWAGGTLATALSTIDDPLSISQTPDELGRQLKVVEQKVKDFLPNYNIKTRFGESTVTPNAWRVRLEGQVGVDPANIDKLRDQFKTVKSLELIRAEAETGYIALSFKRDERGHVSYLECLRDRVTSSRDSNSLILLGRREDNGSLLYYDLRGVDTHALVGGMSNSGKTQLLSTIILDLMLTNSPDHLRLMLVDPKKVEFIRFKSAPHLAGHPIFTEMGDTIRLLDALVEEMERRYDLLAAHEVNELSKYNSLPSVKPMPRLVMVFDEFADWMLDEAFKDAVNRSFQRLAGKARAAGIHLILSTQRPDNTVVSPILRANLGAKIALRVDKKANSEIILDEPGAERLLGRGHGLARLGGERVLFQAAYTPDAVQAALIEVIRKHRS
jgi:S-DNA-T family DNA segregation ATPase FtsK/SpoIIIE